MRASARTRLALTPVERAVAGKQYLLGDDFSGADIMMAFTLAVARFLGMLDETFPELTAYFERLQQRPAFQRAAAD